MIVELVDPRTDPEPEGWTAFVAARRLHPVWEFDLLRVESWLARNPALLAVVREGATITAVATALVCRLPLTARFARPGSRSLVRPGWADIYLPWLSGFPGIEFAAGADVATRVAARRAVERALVRRLGPGLLGVVYRPVRPDELGTFTGRGRPIRGCMPTAVLRNEWSGVDDWLGSLSRERRKSLRRQQRLVAADRGVVARGGPGRTDLDASELAAFVEAHRRRLGPLPREVRTPVSAAYLDRLVRRPDVHTLTYHDEDGKLLAVNTMLDNPVCAVKQHWAARARADGGRRHLYFDAYVRAKRYLTRAGRPLMSSGTGLAAVKQSLGFDLHERHMVLAPRPVLGR